MKCLVTIAVIMSAFAYKLNNYIASGDTNCLIRQHLFHAEAEQYTNNEAYLYKLFTNLCENTSLMNEFELIICIVYLILLIVCVCC